MASRKRNTAAPATRAPTTTITSQSAEFVDDLDDDNEGSSLLAPAAARQVRASTMTVGSIKYAGELALLVEMGFATAEASAALERAKGDIDGAIAIIEGSS